MMPALILKLTDAGVAAIEGLSGSDTVVIAEMGLSDTPFTAAPTLTALPGEFKRVAAVAGTEAAPNITHMSAYDTSSDVWSATGFGLFLDDGTLFASYSDTDVFMSKAPSAFALLAFDIAFNTDLSASISFGDPIFTEPPATETIKGIIELATQAEAMAGTDAVRALTPATGKIAALAWMLAQDGSGSGLDADLLDGKHANQLVPPGVIWMWSGAVVAIPTGWALCDGTSGTPDLRGKFIVGAGGAYAAGDTGGAANHDHGGSSGGHSLTTAEMPAHSHAMFANTNSSTNITGGGAHAAWTTASSSGNQDYDIKGTATAPTLGQTSTEGTGDAHSHSIATDDHLPPYYALAFIMKL